MRRIPPSTVIREEIDHLLSRGLDQEANLLSVRARRAKSMLPRAAGTGAGADRFPGAWALRATLGGRAADPLSQRV